jgi:hypothetical protein
MTILLFYFSFSLNGILKLITYLKQLLEIKPQELLMGQECLLGLLASCTSYHVTEIMLSLDNK